MSITPTKLDAQLQQIHALLNRARTMLEDIDCELEALEADEYIGFDHTDEIDFEDLSAQIEYVEDTIYTLLNPET